MLRVFTDGACSGNPGPMGLGCVIVDDATNQIVLQAAEPAGHGTNQVAEILASAMGLNLLADHLVATTDRPSEAHSETIVVMTDSNYVVMTMEQGWRRKANQEHWSKLDAAMLRLGNRVGFRHIRGHSGHRFNEMADQLAVDGRRGNSVLQSPAVAAETIKPAPVIAGVAAQIGGTIFALPLPATRLHLSAHLGCVGQAVIHGFVTPANRFLELDQAAKLGVEQAVAELREARSESPEI